MGFLLIANVVDLSQLSADLAGNTVPDCDSAAGQGGGQVVTLAISHSNHAPARSDDAFNHYSMLATIEDGWHLGCLAFTCDAANVQPVSDLVGPRGR
jgi:hypothetical protein